MEIYLLCLSHAIYKIRIKTFAIETNAEFHDQI